MRIAQTDLALEHCWIVYPGPQAYDLGDGLSVVPAAYIPQLAHGLRE